MVQPDGVVATANSCAQEFLGLRWDVDVQRYVNDYQGETFHEDGSPCAVEDYPVSRCLQTGQPQGPQTIGVRQPSGEVRWGIFTALPVTPADGQGPCSVVVTFVDITDRRRDELRAHVERQLLDAARMIHFDDRTETTAVFHAPLERLLDMTHSRFGFVARVPADEPIPDELPVLVAVDRDRPLGGRRSHPPVPLDALSARALRERRAVFVEAPGVPPGGVFRSRAPGRALVCPIQAGERTVGLVGLADAPTPYDEALLGYLGPLLTACADLIGALDERRTRARLEAQLARAERLASVGTLAAGMAHEINNPLAYLHLNLESTLRRTRTLVEEARDLERASGDTHAGRVSTAIAQLERNALDAIEGAERVQRIVRDLMTFSRVSEPRRGRVDINAAVRIALKMADHEIKYRARLTCELGDVSAVMGHDGRLSQVFLNLLLNAARSIEEGSPDDNEIRVRSWGTPGRVHVEVSDTGAGIDPEHLHRLFEPFFSTRPAGAGSGLGLSVCHNVVSAHNGTIDVDSELGRGTRFVVSLPSTEATHPPPDEGGQSPERARGASPLRRVLLIDDEPMVLRVLKQLLDRRFEVQTADGLESAIEALGAGERFDVILCDMMMLDGTGMDVHAWLAEHRPDALDGLVFMTGGTFTPRAREFLRGARRRHLSKPFSLKDLDAILVDLTGE